MGRSGVVAVAAVLGAIGAVGVGMGRRVAGVRALSARVPRELRSPVFYLAPPFAGQPPTRRPRFEAAVSRLLRGRGVPTVFDGDGEPVPGYLYEPEGRTRPSGAVLWVHGGGMITGGTYMSHGVANRLARDLGVVVATLDYRLAPEHPFPAALDDCMVVLRWLHTHAGRLGIDPTRIAVGGESAGGGLAAMLAQRAHDEGIPLAFQVLVYPMLDDRTPLRDSAGRGELVWTPAHNEAAWAWFLGHPAGAPEDRPYAAASRRGDLTGLAPAWIGVGDLDLFHDEDVDYARRLRQAGVPVELVVVPGMAHAADLLGGPGTHAFTRSWTAALKRAVGAG